VVVAVRDLEEAVTAFANSGFRVDQGGSHAGQRTRVATVTLRTAYLELLQLERSACPPTWAEALRRYLETSRAGIVGWAIRVPDVEETAASWGIDIGPPQHGTRRDADGRLLRFALGVPIDGQWLSWCPFLVARDKPLGTRPVTHPNGVTSIAAIKISVADLEAARELWRRIPVDRAEHEASIAVALGDACVRYRLSRSRRPGPPRYGIALTGTLAHADRALAALQALGLDIGVAAGPARGFP
jgi:hypothetical protein